MFSITEHESPDLDAITDSLAEIEARHFAGQCVRDCPLCVELLPVWAEDETADGDGDAIPF